ncbi:MAG: hypothetical protein ACP5QD_04660, partial [Candidatus Ratteibacteria bacterium]
DAFDGTINKYRTLFITDRHISLPASQRIEQWVTNGGTLFMTAGAGMFDQYNRKNAIFNRMLGFEQIEILEPEYSRIEFIKQDLPFAKPAGEIVEVDGKRVSIPVFGAIAKIQPNNVSIKGKFSDGSPAVIEVKRGKGRIIYCAFLPGLSYFKPAIPLKPVDRGSTDDAMAHFIPVDFEKNIGELITSAYSGNAPVFVKETTGNPIGFIETTVIESKNGIVIPVINWSTKNVSEAVFEIRLNLKNKKISLASGKPIKSVVINQDKAEIEFDVELADAIIIR